MSRTRHHTGSSGGGLSFDTLTLVRPLTAQFQATQPLAGIRDFADEIRFAEEDRAAALRDTVDEIDVKDMTPARTAIAVVNQIGLKCPKPSRVRHWPASATFVEIWA